MAYRTTKETAIRDASDNEALQETYVCTGEANYARIAWTVTTFDDLGHPTDTWKSDGSHESANWGSSCCGKDNDQTATGIETAYTYDSLNRLQCQIRLGTNGFADGITTPYVLDADGRRLSETVSAGGLTQVVSSAYDTAERLTNSVDQAGRVTQYTYSEGGRITTVTQPGGLTRVTENYLDGRVKSVTGTSGTSQYYDYGVNSDGTRWTKIWTGPAGTNSPVWQKTTTDLLGRTIREERPGFGGVTLATSNAYNNASHLLSSASISGSTLLSQTLYEYDELGNQIRSGLDVNANGVLDLAGPDRVTASDTSYRSDSSNDWWQVNTTILYAGENSDIPTTNSIQKTRLTGLGVASGLGFLASESISVDPLGNVTTTRTLIDRDNKTVTQTATYPDSTNDAVNVTVNGMLQYAISKTGVCTDYAYDALGRQVRAATAGGARCVASATHYNGQGLVDWIEDAASNRTSYAYDDLGRRVAVSDALTNAVYTAYDAQGRVTNTWGAAYPVGYVYDDYGRMVAMRTWRDTNSAPDITRWLYDEATGLLTNKVYPDNQGTTYTYTPDVKLVARGWARGITTTYSYDPLSGGMTNIAYSDNTPAVAFAYNRLGQQISVTDGAGTRTFAYNDALQLIAETNVNGVISRSYDSFGRDAGFTLSDNYSVAYAYDDAGRFTSVSSSVQSATSVVRYAYLPNSGLLAGWSNGTMQIMRNYEDHRDLLTGVTNLARGTLVSAFDYANDAVGRRTQRIDAGSAVATNKFWYNARSELTNAAMGMNGYGYAYDAIGNRTSATNNAEALAHAVNNLNQYTNISDGIVVSPKYDLDGNLTNYGAFAYAWDGENRLVSVSSNGTPIAVFKYDYMSRRYEKTVGSTTNTFVYDGWNVISETIRHPQLSSTNYYVWGLDLSGSPQGAGGIGGLLSVTLSLSSGPITFYPGSDANGNIGDYVYTNGAVFAHRQYDAYGNTVAASGLMLNAIPFWFSSKYRDAETGMYYYGYRFYSPILGRWLSRDPIGEMGLLLTYPNVEDDKEPGNNSYGFVFNNPLCFWDDNGLSTTGASFWNPSPSPPIPPEATHPPAWFRQYQNEGKPCCCPTHAATVRRFAVRKRSAGMLGFTAESDLLISGCYSELRYIWYTCWHGMTVGFVDVPSSDVYIHDSVKGTILTVAVRIGYLSCEGEGDNKVWTRAPERIASSSWRHQVMGIWVMD